MIYLNGSLVTPTLFPDNTSQVWKLDTLDLPGTNWVHVRWDFTHEGELLHLAQIKDLIDSKGFRAALKISYLPYGRQDKEVSNNATFALRSFSKLLNSLNFEEVLITDPHSSVALDLISNSRAVYPIEQVMQVANGLSVDLFCYPDNGATTKYTGGGDVQKEIYDYPCICGEKVRDQATGNITSYKLVGNPKGKRVLIVDDICDGGATFKLLAKDLLDAGALKVSLFVTHGIFSRGLKTLNDAGIHRIFTQYGEAGEVQGNLTYKKF